MGTADAVAHRIVHGGTRFTGPVRLDEDTVEALRALTPLAPLHQPAAVAGGRSVDTTMGSRPWRVS